MRSENAEGIRDVVTVLQCWTFHSMKKHKLITTLWFSKVENDHAKNSLGEKYCDLYKLKILIYVRNLEKKKVPMLLHNILPMSS